MRPIRTPLAAKGFTLIELLVALAIVSLVAVLSWQGLDNVIRLTQRVRDNDDQWEQLRATLSQLERDLKAVHNPRASQQGAGATGAGGNNAAPGSGAQRGGGSTGAPGVDGMTGRQRAADRDDVTLENDDNLDAVVNAALANTQRVQMKAGALEIISSQASSREGPMSLQVRWPWVNGQWRREQVNLSARPDAQGSMSAGTLAGGAISTNTAGVNLTAAQRALFEEPGLRVRGVGIRMWIEGRGWDNEQYLGEMLPAEAMPAPPGSSSLPNAPTGAASGLGNQPLVGGQAPTGGVIPSGPIRLRGVRVRLWMPSGDIYTRVFMLGQES